MRTETAAVKSFLDRRGCEIPLWQTKTPTCGDCDCLLNPTADPEQLLQIDSDRGSGCGVKGVGDINPCTDFVSFRDTGQKRERPRRSPGTLRAGQLAHCSDRKSTLKELV